MKFKLDDLRIEEKEIPEIRGDYSFGRDKKVGEDRTFCLFNCEDHCPCEDYSQDPCPSNIHGNIHKNHDCPCLYDREDNPWCNDY